MQKKLIIKILAAVFVIAECVLFVLIQTTSGSLCEWLCYSSVGLACIFSLLTLLVSRENMMIRAGLLCTMLADYYLVLAEPVQELSGVLVFSVVQMCYFVALLSSENKRIRRVHVVVRFALVALLMPIAFIVLGDGVDALSLWSVFYYANLVCNMIFAFYDYRQRWVLAIGLLAFALCDITLGLGYLGVHYLAAEKGSLLYSLYYSSVNIPWLFYVPSQTLISLSLLWQGKKEKVRL